MISPEEMGSHDLFVIRKLSEGMLYEIFDEKTLSIFNSKLLTAYFERKTFFTFQSVMEKEHKNFRVQPNYDYVQNEDAVNADEVLMAMLIEK